MAQCFFQACLPFCILYPFGFQSCTSWMMLIQASPPCQKTKAKGYKGLFSSYSRNEGGGRRQRRSQNGEERSTNCWFKFLRQAAACSQLLGQALLLCRLNSSSVFSSLSFHDQKNLEKCTAIVLQSPTTSNVSGSGLSVDSLTLPGC